MNAKPLESGLTQIGKSLEEIKEAIKSLKEEGVSAQIAALKPYLAKLKKLDNLDNLANLDNLKKLNELEKLAELKQLKELKEAIEKLKEEGIAAQLKKIDQHIGEHLAHLDKLDSLDSITSSLDAMRKALGDVKEDAAGGEKHTLLNMIETLCARLEGLQNLNKIEGLVKDINTNTAQNGELIKSVNTIVSALGITMENINQIADNTNSLMADYNELAKSVAEALKGVKDAVGDSAKANASLTAAIGSLTSTQSQIQNLLGEIKDKLPEKKEGEGGETDPIQTMADNLSSLNETIQTLIPVVIIQNIENMTDEVVKTLFENLANNSYDGNITTDLLRNNVKNILKDKFGIDIENADNLINLNYCKDVNGFLELKDIPNWITNYYILGCQLPDNTTEDTLLDQIINDKKSKLTKLQEAGLNKSLSNIIQVIVELWANLNDNKYLFETTKDYIDSHDNVQNFSINTVSKRKELLKKLLKDLFNSNRFKKTLRTNLTQYLKYEIRTYIQKISTPGGN